MSLDPKDLAELREVFKSDMQDALKHAKSLRRNGDTVKDYVWKLLLAVFTVDRIVFVALIALTFGYARIQRWDGYGAQISAAATEVDAAKKELEAVVEGTKVQTSTIQNLVDDHQKTTDELRKVQELLPQAVTRSEFQSTIRQQILPRLERIELKLQTLEAR